MRLPSEPNLTHSEQRQRRLPLRTLLKVLWQQAKKRIRKQRLPKTQYGVLMMRLPA